mmetsp:Transcript_2641/g.9040  ORF Transcript_2641/g.9040 Transcript_2641/m.9040 type:complete len:222 (-) Transcript_2641:1994-2659(-)
MREALAVDGWPRNRPAGFANQPPAVTPPPRLRKPLVHQLDHQRERRPRRPNEKLPPRHGRSAARSRYELLLRFLVKALIHVGLAPIDSREEDVQIQVHHLVVPRKPKNGNLDEVGTEKLPIRRPVATLDTARGAGVVHHAEDVRDDEDGAEGRELGLERRIMAVGHDDDIVWDPPDNVFPQVLYLRSQDAQVHVRRARAPLPVGLSFFGDDDANEGHTRVG